MLRSLKRPREDEPARDDSKKLCPTWPLATGSLQSSTDLDQTMRFRAPALTPVDSDDECPSTDGRENKSYTGAMQVLDSQAHPSPLQLNPAPSKLLAAGDDGFQWPQAHIPSQPSPIPRALVNRSLDINASALTAPGFGHEDADQQYQNQADTIMEDSPFHKDQAPPLPPPAIRIPSPISDDDMTMANTNTSDAGAYQASYQVSYRASPAPGLDYGNISTEPVAAHPMSPAASASSNASQTTPVPTSCSESSHRRSALVMGYRADCDKCRCKVPGHYSHIVQRA
ncbi:hypothetical protein N7532_011139 [Penicillium argentinense]|uniref:Uncharacterized protein n=1 Tax=Penicillium argentinense TaxID=1131581 RepID=A0A9W9JUN8_9EURO|nr:uncharacterized protein N7532_011139 [Penicillium argentinense]KAJ5082096.1 hypothetical protein N7532_011139 [Penicillium argentinense]